MAMIHCKECGKEVSEKAATCPNCGAPIHVSPTTPPPKKNTGCLKAILIVGGFFLVATAVMTAINGPDPVVSTPTVTFKHMPVVSAAERQASIIKNTDSFIQQGKALLKREKENEAWMKASDAGKSLTGLSANPITTQEWNGTVAQLRLISPSQPQYNTAQTLLSTFLKQDAKNATDQAITDRKAYAHSLETRLVEVARMDTDVTATGKDSTTLNISWILANKVTAHDLAQTELVTQAKKAGFKKIVFTDGYDFSWSWDLTN